METHSSTRPICTVQVKENGGSLVASSPGGYFCDPFFVFSITQESKHLVNVTINWILVLVVFQQLIPFIWFPPSSRMNSQEGLMALPSRLVSFTQWHFPYLFDFDAFLWPKWIVNSLYLISSKRKTNPGTSRWPLSSWSLHIRSSLPSESALRP